MTNQSTTVMPTDILGLDDLIQTLVATAELHSMKCDPNMQLQGFVLESQMVKGRGNICSVIIKQGILKVGQVCYSLIYSAFHLDNHCDNLGSGCWQ